MKLTELRVKGVGVKLPNGREVSKFMVGDSENKSAESGWTITAHGSGAVVAKDGHAYFIPWPLVVAPMQLVEEVANDNGKGSKK